VVEGNPHASCDRSGWPFFVSLYVGCALPVRLFVIILYHRLATQTSPFNFRSGCHLAATCQSTNDIYSAVCVCVCVCIYIYIYVYICIYIYTYVYMVGRTAQSVRRFATGCKVRGSNPSGGVTFSTPVQTGPGSHPTSYTMGTGSFPGVKRPGRDADHPPHLPPRLMEE